MAKRPEGKLLPVVGRIVAGRPLLSEEYIEKEIPHISSLMNSDLNQVIETSEVIIIGKKEDEFRVLSEKMNNGRVIVDLVRLFDVADARKQYKGIAW